MAYSKQNLHIKIEHRDYQISCKEDERENLLNAVEVLKDEIHNIRNSGISNPITLETGAVMAALNFAGELLTLKEQQAKNENEQQVDKLIEKINTALNN